AAPAGRTCRSPPALHKLRNGRCRGLMSWSPRQFATWFEASFQVGTILLHGSRSTDLDPRVHCGPGGGSTASRQPVNKAGLAHPKQPTPGAICAPGHEDLMKPIRSRYGDKTSRRMT